MGRWNVIIVGSLVLAPLALGIESYVLFKAHHRRVRPAEIIGAIEVNPPAAPRPTEPASLPPPKPALAAAPSADDGPEIETVSDVQADPTIERRRQLMLRRRGEVVQAADEQVFGLLHLPDEKRAAIRAIDSAFARTVQAIGQLPAGADLHTAGLDPNAEQARHAAISEVLGPKETQAFSFAERKAERRVRNHYRTEQVRGR